MTDTAKFVLRGDVSAARCWAFIKRLRDDLKGTDRHVQIIVAPYAADQRDGQRKHYWGYVLKPAAEQARLNGYFTNAEGWHEVLKRMFLPETCAKGVDKWEYRDDEQLLRMSTTDLNEAEFALYIEQVAAYLSTEHHVELPAWEPDQH